MRALIKAFIILGSLMAIFALAFLIYYFIRIKQPHEYTTLSEIAEYAKTLPEFPKSEDNDWRNPRYQEFLEKRSLGIFQSILDKFGYKKIESWSPLYMADLIKYLTNQNRAFGLIDGKHSFVHIKDLKEISLYVFGALNSAFHSLIRDLQHLKELGIIDNNLQILDNKSYLIFVGDAIDRSPYNIDTLILLATLIKKNPLNAFYVPGIHERNDIWMDFGLKRELVLRGRPYSKQPVPFQKELVDYFYTLPEAIYVSGIEKNSAIRISFRKQENLTYDEAQLSSEFLEQSKPVAAHTFKAKKPKQKTLDILVTIGTEDWRKTNVIKHGIGLLNQDQGATFWAVLSSPIYVNQVYIHFYDDAFAQIELKEDIRSSTISATYRDVRTTNGFEQSKKLNLISARPVDNNKIINSIKLASTMSLIRGVPTIGQQTEIGLNLGINKFNLNVNNKNFVRLYIDNDDYVPRIARENVIKFIGNGIKYLMLPIGTPTTMSFLDLAEEHDLGIFFPITGSSDLRKASIHNIIHFRGTYEDEVHALISLLVEQYGAINFAFFYQDDSYGRGPYLAAVNDLKRYGISNSLALPYSRGIISFDEQVRKLREHQADTIGFFATSYAAMEFIRQVGVTELASTQLFGISFVGGLNLRSFIAKQGLSFLFGAVVPNPKVNKTEIADSYRKAMDEIKASYDVFSFEAYITTSIFLHAIESLSEKAINTNNVLNVMENMKNVDFQGIELNFHNKTRSLAKNVWLETGADQEWKKYPIHK